MKFIAAHRENWGVEPICETLNTSPSGFLHLPYDRATFDDSEDERWVFYEKMWNSPGFAKLISHYTDLLMDPAIKRRDIAAIR